MPSEYTFILKVCDEPSVTAGPVPTTSPSSFSCGTILTKYAGTSKIEPYFAIISSSLFVSGAYSITSLLLYMSRAFSFEIFSPSIIKSILSHWFSSMELYSFIIDSTEYCKERGRYARDSSTIFLVFKTTSSPECSSSILVSLSYNLLTSASVVVAEIDKSSSDNPNFSRSSYNPLTLVYSFTLVSSATHILSPELFPAPL